MRLKISLLIPLSLVLGVAAVQSGRTWLDRQALEQQRKFEAMNKVPPLTFATLVVASTNLRHGEILSSSSLKEMPWPQDQLPAGAYAKISDLFKEQPRRAVLTSIQTNEPILTTKITGPGQKANLAAMIESGAKAVTVRVDDVVGVAGFVLPGDRVDVLLTRKMQEREAVSDNILQNLRVLAIDQKADDKLDKPAVARAVTLEVSTEQAQRLIVAQSIGTLTLLLRPLGEARLEAGQRVTSAQLTSIAAPQAAARPETLPELARSSATVGVIRSTVRKEYSVPVEQR